MGGSGRREDVLGGAWSRRDFPPCHGLAQRTAALDTVHALMYGGLIDKACGVYNRRYGTSCLMYR